MLRWLQGAQSASMLRGKLVGYYGECFCCGGGTSRVAQSELERDSRVTLVVETKDDSLLLRSRSVMGERVQIKQERQS